MELKSEAGERDEQEEDVLENDEKDSANCVRCCGNDCHNGSDIEYLRRICGIVRGKEVVRRNIHHGITSNYRPSLITVLFLQ